MTLTDGKRPYDRTIASAEEPDARRYWHTLMNKTGDGAPSSQSWPTEVVGTGCMGAHPAPSSSIVAWSRRRRQCRNPGRQLLRAARGGKPMPDTGLGKRRSRCRRRSHPVQGPSGWQFSWRGWTPRQAIVVCSYLRSLGSARRQQTVPSGASGSHDRLDLQQWQQPGSEARPTHLTLTGGSARGSVQRALSCFAGWLSNAIHPTDLLSCSDAGTFVPVMSPLGR